MNVLGINKEDEPVIMGGGERFDLDACDLRVFFVPQGASTLGQYLAMHDDLYSQNVFAMYSRNSIL